MSVYEYTVRTAEDRWQALRDYAGQVLLIVNVASECGFTPQYAGLQTLYEDMRERGLVILGFPCNQFGNQEPGSDAEIQQFCTTTYQVSFPIFAKIDVNGPTADPLYQYLRVQAPGHFGPEHGRLYEHIKRTRPETIDSDEIKWNFTKFLIGRDGTVCRRYESTATPEDLAPDLTHLLAGPQIGSTGEDG
jgi:glutathione peroxidase